METSLPSAIFDLQQLNELETEFYTPFIKQFEGFKIHEIAYILQLPVATVKLRIRLARRVLGYHLDSFKSDQKIALNGSVGLNFF